MSGEDLSARAVRSDFDGRAPLAACAVSEAEGGGREHDEPAHPYRSSFQRDRDRIVHCSAFRRLDYKTQVFVPHEHDHFRTRLTHTLEVAQVARDIGRALRLNEDLIEAVALAHDLGHPPFGHAGEAALNDLMTGRGGFEHNRQSLRIVRHLEHPYPTFRGLNLTAVVLECLAGHAPAGESDGPPETAHRQMALEGQLVDLADEIAYTSADLEDALSAGWINTEQLGELELWRRAWAAAEAEYPRARAIHKRIRATKAVLAILADDALASTRAELTRRGIDSVEAVRRAPARCVVLSANTQRQLEQAKRFLREHVYNHPRSREEDEKGRRLIRELVAVYLSDESALPERYRRRVPAEGVHRVICDYVAGMTDRFCRQAHADLCA